MTIIDDRSINVPFPPVCFHCRRLQNIVGRTCDAFQNRKIPDEIWSGKNNHMTPFPGDNGLTREAMSNEEIESVDIQTRRELITLEQDVKEET